MAAKLCIGLSKKIGQPDYGSLGASCTVEFEIDASLLQQDLDGFQRNARLAFVACQQAVNDQLARQQRQGADPANAPTNGNGRHSSHARSGGNGRDSESNGNGRPASRSQARAIYAIANRRQIDLPALLRERFGATRPEQLSMADASGLIDELGGVQSNGANNGPSGSGRGGRG